MEGVGFGVRCVIIVMATSAIVVELVIVIMMGMVMVEALFIIMFTYTAAAYSEKKQLYDRKGEVEGKGQDGWMDGWMDRLIGRHSPFNVIRFVNNVWASRTGGLGFRK